MAIYITSKKIKENRDYVIYSYGDDSDNLTGQFKLYKNGNEWETLKLATNDFKNFFSSRMMIKILSFYEENGYFPDELSRQS